MLHIHATCPCCMTMPMLNVYVHAACPCCMSMSKLHVYVHAVWLFPCCVHVYAEHGHRHRHEHGRRHGHASGTWTYSMTIDTRHALGLGALTWTCTVWRIYPASPCLHTTSSTHQRRCRSFPWDGTEWQLECAPHKMRPHVFLEWWKIVSTSTKASHTDRKHFRALQFLWRIR